MHVCTMPNGAVSPCRPGDSEPVQRDGQDDDAADDDVLDVVRPSHLLTAVAQERHDQSAKSAFIYAYVLTGAIRSVVGTEPAKVYQAGESFHEDPGTHHRVSENASETNPASLLAVFIVDADDQPLTVPNSKSDTR